VEDEDLRRSVPDELMADPRLSVDADLTVSVADGEVTVRGTVVTQRDKLEATESARRVPGVTSVKDEIEVRGRNDADLRTDVVEELAVGHIPASVVVEVHEGTVALTGVVDRQDLRDAAAFIAKVVPGVVGVDNHVEVKGQTPTSDVEYSTRAAVDDIAVLDAEMAGDEDTARRELGARLAAAARRIEQVRAASEAGGNVVRFRMERYIEALESDAIDAHSRLSAIPDVRSYDGKILQREITAMESGVAVAEAKLDAARAAERDDHRGEADAEIRAKRIEVRGMRAVFDRTFGAKKLPADSETSEEHPDDD
jgi:osmotically-inducible protein OsmY